MPQKSPGVLEEFERKISILVASRIPVIAVVRLCLGIIYFWFGFQKFQFIPGQSPAEDLITSVWGRYLDAELFILVLAVVETLIGVLLLCNVRTRLLSAILVGHVLGTFSTAILDPGSTFQLQNGVFSLTMAGQYIFKNILIVACCLSLAGAQARRQRREKFRVNGKLCTVYQEVPMITNDISLGGISLYCTDPHSDEIEKGQSVRIELTLPLSMQPVVFDLLITSIVEITYESGTVWRLAGSFTGPGQLRQPLLRYLSEHPLRICPLKNQ